MPHNRRITAIIRRMALAVALIVSVLPPLGYWLVAFNDLSADLQFKAKVKATAFSALITSNPELWIYAENRMQGLLTREPVPLETEFVQVYDSGGALITQAGQVPAPPLLSRAYPLYDAVRLAGKITVSHSMQGVLIGAAIAAMIGFLCGVAVFMVMRVIPLRALQHAVQARMDAEERFRVLIRSADSAIIVLDSTGCVLEFNQAAETFYDFRFQRGAPVGAGFLSALRFDENTATIPHSYESSFCLPDGTERTVLWNISRLTNTNGLGGAVLLGQDITERKHVEAVLLQAKQQAETANQAKSDFLSVMSHELRSPMTGILGAISLLLHTSLEQEQKQYAQIAHDSAWGLLRLLNDILDMAKLEAGKLTIESLNFDVARLVDEVLHLMKVPANNKDIGLTIKCGSSVPPFLQGDAVRIRQILFNLVGNAIKFTETGAVTVVLSYADNLLKVAVTDTGIGISEEIQPRLFDRFSQADGSISRTYGGTGLGLAICKELCELMGGRIGLQSVVGFGSTFWFTARCDVGEASAVTTIETPLADSAVATPLHILIAEDSPINQIVVKAMLSKAGHTMEIANNGREAVEAVVRAHFDLVLMDVQMPEMDGISATQAIRALSPPQSTVPIIALTANAMRSQKAEYLAVGMDDYVSKPFTESSLIGTIARLMARRAGKKPEPAANGADPISRTFLDKPCLHDIHIFDEAQLGMVRQCTDAIAFRSLLDQLSETITRSVAELQQAWQQGDLLQSQKIAHRLKGEAGTMGALRVATIAAYLNKASDLATMRAAFGDVHQAHQDTVAAIADLIQRADLTDNL